MPECLIYGENGGFLQNLQRFVKEHVSNLLGSPEAASRFARRIFNAFYNRTKHSCIGFKEVRYGEGPYWQFLEDVAFLQDMCERPYFVFHYSQDIEGVVASQQRNWRRASHRAKAIMTNQIMNFQRFQEQNPAIAFLSLSETTFKSPEALVRFLGLHDAPPFAFWDVNNG